MMSFLLTVFISFSSGLGYIVGTGVAKLLGGWQWGLRVSIFMLLSKIRGDVCILGFHPRDFCLDNGCYPPCWCPNKCAQ